MGPAVAGLIGAGIGAVAGIAGTLITTFYMSETVYIETSILGYLTARSTKNLILAANM